jgi:hypothetical protein
MTGMACVDESRTPAGPDAQTAAVLYEAVRAQGQDAWVADGAIARWMVRARFASRCAPELPALEASHLESALARACEGCTSVAELRKISLLGVLQQALTPAQINGVVRKYIDPSKIVLVRAGDFAKNPPTKPTP